MKTIGSILLALGFLAGTFTAVAHEDHVDWLYYGLCIACMLAGMVLLRTSRKEAAARAGDQHSRDVETLKSCLANLIDKARAFEGAADDESQLGIHERIDAELMADIHDFVEARESMIPRLGMQSYADIMSPFANGERLLNRAWSASVDGYVDEVRTCVTAARTEWEKAQSLLLERAPA